jgi:selenocysteine lyase/cysteine desulfurase
MHKIAEYERMLSAALLDVADGIPGVIVHGLTDRARLQERVPTLCFTVAGRKSSAVADSLAAKNIGVRSGHMYSPRLMKRLGLMPAGVVRASLVHYNTFDEIARFGNALGEIARS